MEREQAIDRILSARTLGECQAAEKVLAAWMQTHPTDWAMLDAGEQLTIIRESWAESEGDAAPNGYVPMLTPAKTSAI